VLAGGERVAGKLIDSLFRGRGYLQVTGRGNYAAVQQEIDLRFPGSGVDIVADPDSATQVRAGLIAAFAFWSLNLINGAADQGLESADVDNVTDHVNPGEGEAGRAVRLTSPPRPAPPAPLPRACPLPRR